MITNLKVLRENKWLTQEYVADTLCISRQKYMKIEKWETELSLWEAVKLSKLLSIDLDVLSWEDIWVVSRNNIDWEKYKQIIWNCIKYGADDDWRITKTKLAKLAYLIDFWWFYNHLKPITWLEYRRDEQWPVPDAYFTILNDLEREELIAIEKKWDAYLIENIEAPNHSKINEEELEFIKKVCRKWKGKNTKAIVDFTHNQIPWAVSRKKEIIPYELITQEEPNNVY